MPDDDDPQLRPASAIETAANAIKIGESWANYFVSPATQSTLADYGTSIATTLGSLLPDYGIVGHAGAVLSSANEIRQIAGISTEAIKLVAAIQSGSPPEERQQLSENIRKMAEKLQGSSLLLGDSAQIASLVAEKGANSQGDYLQDIKDACVAFSSGEAHTQEDFAAELTKLTSAIERIKGIDQSLRSAKYLADCLVSPENQMWLAKKVGEQALGMANYLADKGYIPSLEEPMQTLSDIQTLLSNPGTKAILSKGQALLNQEDLDTSILTKVELIFDTAEEIREVRDLGTQVLELIDSANQGTLDQNGRATADRIEGIATTISQSEQHHLITKEMARFTNIAAQRSLKSEGHHVNDLLAIGKKMAKETELTRGDLAEAARTVRDLVKDAQTQAKELAKEIGRVTEFSQSLSENSGDYTRAMSLGLNSLKLAGEYLENESLNAELVEAKKGKLISKAAAQELKQQVKDTKESLKSALTEIESDAEKLENPNLKSVAKSAIKVASLKVDPNVRDAALLAKNVGKSVLGSESSKAAMQLAGKIVKDGAKGLAAKGKKEVEKAIGSWIKDRTTGRSSGGSSQRGSSVGQR